jgi:hypothetical protein
MIWPDSANPTLAAKTRTRRGWGTRDSGGEPADRSGDTVEEAGALAAKGFKPAADVNLRVGFTAIVPRVRRVGSFFRPFEDRQLRIAAVDDNPPHRIVALDTANLTSINRIDHRPASQHNPFADLPFLID